MLPSLRLSPTLILAAMATRSSSWAERVVIETDESEALLESGSPDESVNTFGQFL